MSREKKFFILNALKAGVVELDVKITQMNFLRPVQYEMTQTTKSQWYIAEMVPTTRSVLMLGKELPKMASKAYALMNTAFSELNGKKMCIITTS